ncbi:2-oxo acid dehydrogenase subunit E2 [Photobacterium gaetbulicola]|uniref:Dihydrolipoamide acetyltransferase component of pyruvate dehydrogenase complex n=1 Tax=Photobacterium gaetbulicola Gung47 TaxID=658445 RepID=A0A0C5WEC2_9GAMM|nr:dihydrolipoamide acetyltransferase family protein [Photobacterium gaetbulicola]AJR05448.1 putative dehydrogenase catalytic domain-containing protein [Photobacterium gaetbulicola Gung47]PSU12767.1 2-oxo acid dehydrogenase subunit E2 [Photobacterium gaetbulicola]
MDSNQTSPNLIDITMPALGADMRDGTLIEWQVKRGDKVAKGDIIAVIETSKGAIDMEAYHDGTITELLVEPIIKLPVGSVMARMTATKAEPQVVTTPALGTTDSTTATGKQTPADSRQDGSLPTVMVERHPYLARHPSVLVQPNPSRQLVSPAARLLAIQQGIMLSGLTGSGPNGAILLRDIPAKPEQHARHEIKDESSSMRQAISDAMSMSKQQIPHYYLALDIDLSTTQAWLKQQNQHREPEQRLLITAVIIAAIARQLPRYPALNGSCHEGQFTPAEAIHIGNTISLRDGGLVVPAILDADQRNLEQVMASLKEITERARRGRLRSSELTGATITVTSIGERGADSLIGVIYPPQVAIIGLGRLRKAPIVSNDKLCVGDVMTVTLSADHRVSDGLTGSRFLTALAKQLQHPEDLL